MAVDCGAGGWGHWEAEACSEHGRLHWGALWLCGAECHRCHCWDLQSRRDVRDQKHIVNDCVKILKGCYLQGCINPDPDPEQE